MVQWNIITDRINNMNSNRVFLSVNLLADSDKLIKLVTKNTSDIPLLVLSHLNYIYNYVVWIENHFKALTVFLVDHLEFSSEDLIKKIEQKIKLSELHLFKSPKITIGKIIVELFNCQNLSDIDKILTHLFKLNQSLFTKLDDFIIDLINKESGLIDNKIRPIYKILSEAVEYRHEFTHNLPLLTIDETLLIKLKTLIEELKEIILPLLVFEISKIEEVSGLKMIKIFTELDRYEKKSNKHLY